MAREVAHRQGVGFGAEIVGNGISEGAVAIAQQHGYLAAVEVGGDQVRVAVAVEVRGGHVGSIGHAIDKLASLEGAVAVAPEHDQQSAVAGGDDSIQVAVPEEVAEGHVVRVIAAVKDFGRLEGAVAVAQ